MSKKGLGEILREADLITEEQLREALTLQRTFGERLASILVRQRILTEKFAVTYLGRQLGVPAIDLSKQQIDLALLELISLEFCSRHLVFPVKVAESRLQLAMADPLDRALVAQVERMAGNVTPMIALDAAIKNAVAEARRAVRAGQKTITPNLLRPRETGAGEAGPPRQVSAPPPPAAPARAPAPPREAPVPVRPLRDEDTVVETLGGAPIPRPTAPQPLSPVPSARAEMQTILLACSDSASIEIVERALAGATRRLLTAASGAEALERVESVPDLAILEGELPGVYGFDICRRIKQTTRLKHIPVVIVTGSRRGWRFAADVREKYLADEVAEKPLDPGELKQRVATLLKRHPSEPEAAAQHLREGAIALKQDRVDAAIASFAKGLEADPLNDLLHYYMAMAYEKKDMLFHAIDHYERAIRANADFEDAITALANLYQRHELWRMAAELWERALSRTQDESVRERLKEHILALL